MTMPERVELLHAYHYAGRLGPLYHSIAQSRTAPVAWGEELIGRIEAERRQDQPFDALRDRSGWRDRARLHQCGR